MFESNMDSKYESKKSQLLSLDGWERYQKELTRLCFEFWEVNEKQVLLNNSLQSDLMREPAAEIQLPASLFADEHDSHENTVGFESKVLLDNNTISEEFKNNECVEITYDVFKNKSEFDPVIRQWSAAINNNIDWQTYGNCSKYVDVKGNERCKRKILKKFSFYKHSLSKQVKPHNKQQSLTFDRYSSCTLKDWRKCKKWLDTVEKTKTHNPHTSILSGNIEENFEKIHFNGRSDTFMYNALDIETTQMAQKVKKLLKSINEKEKLLLTNIDDVNAHTVAKFGPSNKFKYLFKSVFQGSHDDELDTQLLNGYIKHINEKLNTWQALLDCLDDVRQRISNKKNNMATGFGTLEDAPIKYECSETNMDCRGNRQCQVMTGVHSDESNNCSRFVETNHGIGCTNRQKKYNFFKLLNRTKRSVDMRAAAACCCSSKRNGVLGDVHVNYGNGNNNYYYNNDYCFRGGRTLSGIWIGGENTPDHCGDAKSRADGRKRPGRMRKSFSDTDLHWMRRISPLDLCEEIAATHSTGDDQDERCNHALHFCRDYVARRLWEDRQECFRTVMARLEYVGSTFREPHRLAGLRALCKVDVLVGFGRPAEAVDLFVRSALPLSENPDLMIRKAEAAYDWKFFCHLSMWRHSYKE